MLVSPRPPFNSVSRRVSRRLLARGGRGPQQGLAAWAWGGGVVPAHSVPPCPVSRPSKFGADRKMMRFPC